MARQQPDESTATEHDEETGSWWQQASGEAVFGPRKGRKLDLVPYDEISFAAWKREHPGGRGLQGRLVGSHQLRTRVGLQHLEHPLTRPRVDG